MSASALSYGTARIVAGENDLVFTPRNGVRGRRGVLLLPGQLQTVIDYNDPSNPFQQAFFRAIRAADIPGVAIDAGVAQWGSSESGSKIETGRTTGMPLIGAASDKIIIVAASAGVIDGLNYTRNNPTRVAALIGIMPACDLDDLRDNNRGGTRAAINAAWGMPVGSTSATDPLPEEANPNTAANAALIASSGAAFRFYYSSADTVCVPATVESLADKLGFSPTLISDSVGHSDALFGEVPIPDLARLAHTHL